MAVSSTFIPLLGSLLAFTNSLFQIRKNIILQLLVGDQPSLFYSGI